MRPTAPVAASDPSSPPAAPLSSSPSSSALPPLPLPPGVRSRQVDGVNGLSMHCLEAGFETPGRPLVILLHGFPDLAWCWRHQFLPLAAAGFHVVAPDQRGYGRTTGWQATPGDDPSAFRMLNLATDVLALALRLGYDEVAAVVGHDFGAPVAAWCALTRPDVFHSLMLLAAPFAGPPSLPGPGPRGTGPTMESVIEGLAQLPRPRLHYQWYYSTDQADAHMREAPQGLHDFLRAYFHYKSADFGRPGSVGAGPGTVRCPAHVEPYPLPGFNVDAFARLPPYYVMDLDLDMAATVAPAMPSPELVAACAWLTEADLAVYTQEFRRTGFQGGLQWYRCRTDPRFASELQLYAGRQIEVPTVFIGGRQDWCVHQSPGGFEAMQSRACADLRGAHLIEGAGHWLQQEQPAAVTGLMLDFLAGRHGARAG